MKRSLRFQILLFITVRIVFNAMIRIVYPFLPVFSRGLGVDLSTLSQAMALRSAGGILGPFLGAIGDSKGRKVGMLIGLALLIASAALVTIWPNYPVFVLSLVLSILGYFVFNPSMQAYLGDQVPYKERGRALALTELGWSLSFIIGMPLIGWIIARRSWQAAFPFLGVLGVLSFLALTILLPPDPAPREGRPGLMRSLWSVVSSPPALTGLLMGTLLSMANELINLVYGSWLEASFTLKIAALGAIAAIIGFSELSGELLSAGLVDRMGKPRAMATGILINCLAALALLVTGRSLGGAMAGLFLFYLSFEFAIVSSIPLMTEVLPQARATLMAAYVAFLALGRALGAVLVSSLYAPANQGKLNQGLLAIVFVVIPLNLGALLALNRLKRAVQERG